MNDKNRCRLHAHTGMSCGPAAVCAVTGKSPDVVKAAIIAAAREDNENPQHLDDCHFRHQARAVELLGFDLFDIDGRPFQARDIPRHAALTAVELNARIALSEFVRTNRSNDVLLCRADRVKTNAAETEAHSFAVDHNWYYDNNTGGRILTVAEIPMELSEFRVGDRLIVRRRR